MLHNNRIILRNNAGVLTDLSAILSDITSTAQVISISPTDKLFLGSPFPFNHRHFEIVTPNDQATSATVALWTGGAWMNAVDQIDQTSQAGASFGKSGIISWVPDRDTNRWSFFPRSQGIPELSSTRIYDLYWAQLTFSAPMNINTSIRYIGHKFSSDSDLALEYPDLSLAKLMSAYKTGKTNWIEQSILAAEYIIQDLKEMGVIIGAGQILDWKVFQKASVHKTASIAFYGLGEGFADQRKAAESAYRSALQIKSYAIDLNGDARLDQAEQTRVSESLER